MTGPKPCAPACTSGHPQAAGGTPFLGNVPPFLYIQYFAISQNFFTITANNHRLQYPHPSHSPWALREATPLLQSLRKVFLGKMSTFTTSKDTNLGVAKGYHEHRGTPTGSSSSSAYCRQAQGFSCTPTDRFSPVLQRHPHPHYPRDGAWKRTVLQLK